MLEIAARSESAELTCELDAPLYERIDAPATPEKKPFLSSFRRRTSAPPSLPVTLSRLLLTRARGNGARLYWHIFGQDDLRTTFDERAPARPRVCGGFEIHYDPVEWNCGPAITSACTCRATKKRLRLCMPLRLAIC